ncbi:hypothetical protein CK203_115689 [Vitis vinifera]|uniref:starch synthase n=1 Tax=Vitis vinifera TaxID=29760 RepID=A0A438C980_VITVI|nr:hypothetical protein CK203_115689 [Vitis vinifera]
MTISWSFTLTSFVFEGIDEGSLNWALDRAFSFYRESKSGFCWDLLISDAEPEEWNTTIQKVMEIDNSWNNTAGKYIDIYNSVRVRC